MAASKIECSVDRLISPGTTNRRQMVGVWSFSEIRSWMSVLPGVRRAWAPMPEHYETGRKNSSDVGQCLIITAGPNRVDIPNPVAALNKLDLSP